MIYYIFTHNLEKIIATRSTSMFIDVKGTLVPLHERGCKVYKPYNEFVVVRCSEGQMKGWLYASHLAKSV